MNSIKHLNTKFFLTEPTKRTAHISSTLLAESLHPAQGMRVLRRKNPTLWRNLCNTQTKDVSQMLYDAVQHIILPVVQKYILHGYNKPDHYLIHTNMPSITEAPHTRAPFKAFPNIHFIRTQRRYNKRRYARVRAISRPSFWAGMSVSTLVTASFWGASMQELDWITTLPVITDINTLMFVFYVVLSLRFFRIFQSISKPHHREQNKSRRGWRHVLMRKASSYLRW